MKRLKISEWKLQFPIKKLILAVLWFFCFVVSIRGISQITGMLNEMNVKNVYILCAFLIITGISLPLVIKYIKEQYHCVPYMCKYVGKEKLEHEIEGEQFIRLEQTITSQWNEIEASTNWYCIKNRYICKHLIVQMYLTYRYGAPGNHHRNSMNISFLLLTGDLINIKLGTANYKQKSDCLKQFLEEQSPVGLKIQKVYLNDRNRKEMKKLLETGFQAYKTRYPIEKLLKANEFQRELLSLIPSDNETWENKYKIRLTNWINEYKEQKN